MNRRDLLRLLSGGAAVALVSGVSGCVYSEARPVRRVYPYPGPYGVYDYYYYPGANVYYHQYSDHYYYYDDHVWRRSRRLPRHIHLDDRERRRFEYRGERPYDRNREHREQFSTRAERLRRRQEEQERARRLRRDRQSELRSEPQRRPRQDRDRDRQTSRRTERDRRRDDDGRDARRDRREEERRRRLLEDE